MTTCEFWKHKPFFLLFSLLSNMFYHGLWIYLRSLCWWSHNSSLYHVRVFDIIFGVILFSRQLNKNFSSSRRVAIEMYWFLSFLPLHVYMIHIIQFCVSFVIIDYISKVLQEETENIHHEELWLIKLNKSSNSWFTICIFEFNYKHSSFSVIM